MIISTDFKKDFDKIQQLLIKKFFKKYKRIQSVVIVAFY